MHKKHRTKNNKREQEQQTKCLTEMVCCIFIIFTLSDLFNPRRNRQNK
jgi:hypothetical protein